MDEVSGVFSIGHNVSHLVNRSRRINRNNGSMREKMMAVHKENTMLDIQVERICRLALAVSFSLFFRFCPPAV